MSVHYNLLQVNSNIDCAWSVAEKVHRDATQATRSILGDLYRLMQFCFHYGNLSGDPSYSYNVVYKILCEHVTAHPLFPYNHPSIGESEQDETCTFLP